MTSRRTTLVTDEIRRVREGIERAARTAARVAELAAPETLDARVVHESLVERERRDREEVHAVDTAGVVRTDDLVAGVSELRAVGRVLRCADEGPRAAVEVLGAVPEVHVDDERLAVAVRLRRQAGIDARLVLVRVREDRVIVEGALILDPLPQDPAEVAADVAAGRLDPIAKLVVAGAA